MASGERPLTKLRRALTFSGLKRSGAKNAVAEKQKRFSRSMENMLKELNDVLADRTWTSYEQLRTTADPVNSEDLPGLEDKYVAMHDEDWDVYEQAGTGNVYYHNPVTGETSWKPPRRSPASPPFIPRTANSIRTYGAEKRFSVVKPNSPKEDGGFRPPAGYREVYDKVTGLISYIDEDSGMQWFTNLDSSGQLYFYSKIGDKMESSWSLPSKTQVETADANRGWFSLISSGNVILLSRETRDFFASPTLGDIILDGETGILNLKNVVKSRSSIDLTLYLADDDHHHSHEVTRTSALSSISLCLKECPDCDFRWSVVRIDRQSIHLVPTGSQSEPLIVKLSFNGLETCNRWIGDIQEISCEPRKKSVPVISTPVSFKKATPQELNALLEVSAGAKDLERGRSKSRYRKRDTSEPPKLQRNGLLTRSFRRMKESVMLRPKAETLDAHHRVSRTPSTRSQFLSRFFERRGNKKDELVKKGILKHEAVFGNNFEDMPKFKHETDPDSIENELPAFLVMCVRKIESLITVPGVYRVNGDSSKVQKIRIDVDSNNYKSFEACNDVTVLAGALKLLFRELPQPLIPAECRDVLKNAKDVADDKPKLIQLIRDSFEYMHPVDVRVLQYLLQHLKRVGDEPANQMTYGTLAIVMSPNLVHGVVEARRPESLITEIENNNAIVQTLISLSDRIFESK